MTQSQWITLAFIGLIFVPTGWVVAARSTWVRRRVLLAEIAALRASRCEVADAQTRFDARSAGIRRSILRAAPTVGVLGYLCSYFVPLALAIAAPSVVIQAGVWYDISFFPTEFVVVVLLSVNVLSTYDLFSGLLVEPLASAVLGGPPFTRARAFARFLRRLLLLYLPPLAVVEAIGLFLVPALGPAIGQALAQPGADLILLALGALVSGALAIRFWLAPSAPIEQTQWVALAPRAREWARLADVELRDVRVRFAARLRVADGAVRGHRHPTLYLSDLFLANSDWRQQDALITHLLGLAHERSDAPRISRLAPALDVLAVVVIVSSTLLVGVKGWPLGFLWFANPILFVVVLVGELLVVTASGVYLIYSCLRRQVFGRTPARARILAADRYSAALTGDPLALAVALYTLARLNTAPHLRLRFNGAALTADRIAAIQRMLDQPGPRAAWADQPVPAIITVATGPRAFTVPLEQAPPPVPVPVSPRGETAFYGAQPQEA